MLSALLLGGCGSTTNGVSSQPTISHVVVIAMENHTRKDVIGSGGAPYITGLANTYGEANDYTNLYHPSLPNYLAVTGGTNASTAGSDCAPSPTCGSSLGSLFSQLGSNWKAYEESMPSHCDKTDSGNYAVRHNPPAYYRTLSNCSTRDVALASTPTFAAALTWVTPNLCHDMHNTCGGSSIVHADTWLKGWLPKVLNSTQYKAGTLAVFCGGTRTTAQECSPSL